MDDCAAILALAARVTGAERFVFRGVSIDPFAPPERLTVVDAFARYAGIDLAALLATDDPAPFAAAARGIGVRVAADDTWGDVFSRVLVEKVEPQLGQGRATVLYEYPIVQSPLARPTAADPRVAERFELYACGVELANGFGELTDPLLQRRASRRADGREGAHLWRPLSDRRGLHRGARRDAAGLRHCARARPAGDARDRRHAHRAGAVDAAAGTWERSITKRELQRGNAMLALDRDESAR